MIEFINMYYNLIYDTHADIIIICRSLREPRLEVIQMPEALFASAADAAGMLDASLDHLTSVDWASLGTQAHGEMLAYL